MFDETKIDALLAATDGHTPGPWRAVIGYAPIGEDGEPDYSGDCNSVESASGFGIDMPSDEYRQPDIHLVAAAPAFRAAVVHYREALRRAALLTPESVKAICEREGFTLSDFPCDIGQTWWKPPASFGHGDWLQTRSQGMTRINGCATVGQLEDAIAKAKGETNA